MPPQPANDIILQQIFDQLKDLRDDIRENFVTKTTYEADLKPIRQDVEKLQRHNENWLNRVYTAVALVSATISLLILLHVIP